MGQCESLDGEQLVRSASSICNLLVDTQTILTNNLLRSWQIENGMFVQQQCKQQKRMQQGKIGFF